MEMSIPLFTHQQHKEDAFSESLKNGVHLPFQDLTLSRNCQEPHYFSALDHFHFLLSTFKPPPINIYLCQILSALLYPLSLPLVLETGENKLLISLEVKKMREETKLKKVIQFGKYTLILIHVFKHQVNEGLSPPLNDSSSLLQTHL